MTELHNTSNSENDKFKNSFYFYSENKAQFEIVLVIYEDNNNIEMREKR